MPNTAVDTRKERRAAAGTARVRDFLELMKPRVMSLVVFTALTGIVLAPGAIDPVTALVAVICIAVGAGASGALNMWYDADIDIVMARTRGRPVPSGRVSAREALVFGLVLSLVSVGALAAATNWVAAGLLAFTIFFYVAIYTAWLKRSTPQNIVIGGAAGAFPPMIGWAAASGRIEIESFVLFLIIFLWTPPHFWALALNSCTDYARAGVPMLPVVAGEAETRKQILIYSLILVPVGFLPWIMGFAGLGYAMASVILGIRFLFLAWATFRNRDKEHAARAPARLFGFSIVYLFGLFAVLLFEHLAGFGSGGAF